MLRVGNIFHEITKMIPFSIKASPIQFYIFQGFFLRDLEQIFNCCQGLVLKYHIKVLRRRKICIKSYGKKIKTLLLALYIIICLDFKAPAIEVSS